MVAWYTYREYGCHQQSVSRDNKLWVSLRRTFENNGRTLADETHILLFCLLNLLLGKCLSQEGYTSVRVCISVGGGRFSEFSWCSDYLRDQRGAVRKLCWVFAEGNKRLVISISSLCLYIYIYSHMCLYAYVDIKMWQYNRFIFENLPTQLQSVNYKIFECCEKWKPDSVPLLLNT